MKYLVSLSFLLITSCASIMPVKQNYKQVSYIESPEGTVFFYEKGIKPSEYRRSRAIASVQSEVSYTDNKEVYFKALWQQSLTLSKYLGVEHQSVCPAFHQSVVNEQLSAQSLVSKVKVNSSDPVLYPYLAIKDGRKALYMEGNIENKLNDYILSHYKTVNQEVKELCNTGVSDNFFVFENTIRYFASKGKMQKVDYLLNSYLKIPVFANVYLLDSLKSKGQHLSQADRRVLQKLDVEWFEGYLYKLRQRRENIISMR